MATAAVCKIYDSVEVPLGTEQDGAAVVLLWCDGQKHYGSRHIRWEEDGVVVYAEFIGNFPNGPCDHNHKGVH